MGAHIRVGGCSHNPARTTHAALRGAQHSCSTRTARTEAISHRPRPAAQLVAAAAAPRVICAGAGWVWSSSAPQQLRITKQAAAGQRVGGWDH